MALLSRQWSVRGARWSPLALALTAAAACTGVVEGSNATCEECGVAQVTTTANERPAGAGDPTSEKGVAWTTRFPKLSNQQWENTVTALFYLDTPLGYSKDFTQEPLDKGYTARAAADLTVGSDAWVRYRTAAEQVAAAIVGDDRKLAKVTPTGTFANVAAKGAAFVTSFGRRAYRRPLAAEESRAYSTLFAQGPSLVGGDAFKAGARLVIEAMLQSPHFLYRVESSTKAGSDRKIQLSGYEVASRLSYALWNAMPSDTLLNAAGAGELNTKEGVARWAERMLDDARGRETSIAFHEQTFQTAAYGTQEKVAELRFDAQTLAPTLREEARRLFELVVVEQGRGIAALLTEPVAFVNEDTAPIYGITGVTGKSLQQRKLDPTQRAGLFTQVGFLSKNATRSGTDPVHRGLAVIRQLLCDEPDPPPMMFQLPAPVAGLTTREVYERATVCGGSCHTELINPPGFSFENFDAIGRFRSTEIGKPVDPTGALMIRTGYTPDERRGGDKKPLTFDNAVDLMTQLAVEPRVHVCYARHFMEHALAHELDPVERGASEALGTISHSRASLRAMVGALVQLDAFRFRVSDT